MALCSIIIPVHGQMSLTQHCLDRLLETPPASLGFEIIVVYDASPDLTPALLARYGDRIRVLTHQANTGYAVACNDAVAVARGDYLLFLNNDTLPQAGWLDALVRHADRHPAAAVVGSKLLFPNDTIQHAGVVIAQDGWPRHIYAGFPADHPAVNKTRPFKIVTAGCALMRRTPFEQVGGFDTAFVNGLEDVDLCLRLGERDHAIHYCHESVLVHLESVTIRRSAQAWEAEQNGRLYRQRWADRLEPDDLAYYRADGLLAFHYEQYYPFRVSLSPLLGLVDGDEQAPEADRLLQLRARQVGELLQENIRLRLRLDALELERALGLAERPTGLQR